MKSSPSSCARLPESVRQVAEVIGEEAALKLVRMWPRTKTKGDVASRVVVYVPAKLPMDHRLVAVLGYPKAEQLVRTFGGEILFLAECRAIVRDARDQCIADALKRRMSPAAIAVSMGMCERQVRRIAARIRADIAAMDARKRLADHARNSELAAA